MQDGILAQGLGLWRHFHGLSRANGPVDSMRWGFAEALRDYRLLQALGVERNDPLLKQIKTFEDFPKTEAWRNKTRAALFARVARGKRKA